MASARLISESAALPSSPSPLLPFSSSVSKFSTSSSNALKVALASTTLIISLCRSSFSSGTNKYERSVTYFWQNSVEDFNTVYVSSPTVVSKSMRHRAGGADPSRR
uniref:Uncharacterized protein n=1 Tax=Corethron hystrix TaxID=216773 RepID=A0A7S1BP42_9STRA